jgi:hypothetical protein
VASQNSKVVLNCSCDIRRLGSTCCA